MLGLLRLLHRPRVGHDPHDLLPQDLRILEDVERVAVALRHLLAVGARHAGGTVEHLRLRHHEGLAEEMIEAGGQVAADLDVLHLILADRHDVGIVHEDVGRHQHGIGEQPGVGRQPLRLLVLVGVAAFEQAHRRAGHQQPAEFGDLRHVGLHEERRPIGIEPQGQQIERGVERVLREPLRGRARSSARADWR